MNYDNNDALGVNGFIQCCHVRVLSNDWHYMDVPQEQVDYQYMYPSLLLFFNKCVFLSLSSDISTFCGTTT